MRKIAFAVLVAAALNFGLDQSASAANYNWSGWYLGLNAGGNWGTSAATTTVQPSTFPAGFGSCPACRSDIAAIGNQKFDTSGFTGGVQGGYNWQSGNLLVGIELDYQYFRSAGSISTTGFAPSLPGLVTVNTSVSTDWLFTARPRLGAVANNWLFYGTGGLAVTKLKATWHYHDTLTTPAAENAAASATKTGWTIGGGIETALPGNWLLGGEYLYVKFGSISASEFLKPGGAFLDTFNNTADLKSSIVRARFSKKF